MAGRQHMGRSAPGIRAGLLALACGVLLAAPQVRGQEAIDIVWINGPLYLLSGAGANVTASVGYDGVLLVDSGSQNMSATLLRAIRGLQERLAEANRPAPLPGGAETRSSVVQNRAPAAPPKPVRYIINTSAGLDHIGGNQLIGAEEGVTFTGGNVAGNIADAGEGAAVYAHERVMQRLVTDNVPFPMLPTATYYQASNKLSHFFNGDGVRMVHMPAAHSDGDTIVQFTRSDVIVTGEIFSQTGYPRIDVARGGTINGVLDALNYILDVAIPEFRTEGGTMIVPARGRLSDSADVGYYRDMLTIIRDNMQEMIKRGMTLEQIKAARPTKAYDPRFGADSGPWTTEMFVEAVYANLTAGR